MALMTPPPATSPTSAKPDLKTLSEEIGAAVAKAVLETLQRAHAQGQLDLPAGRVPGTNTPIPMTELPVSPASIIGAAAGAAAVATVPQVAPDRNRLTDRFNLLGATGGDAFGECFLGREITNGNNVIVRLLHKQLAMNSSFMSKFRRDCDGMMGISEHKHVVKVLTHGVHYGQPYVVLESVRGRSVADVILAGDPVPEVDVLRMAEQVADALLHVHLECGLNHCDLRPTSIMIEYSGIAGIQASNEIESIKVSDFVGPRIPWHDDKRAPSVGSPYYTAPEQFNKESTVDARSDIYALGAIMYHLLTGKPPYSGTAEEVKAGHLGTAVLDPGSLQQLSPQTRQIVSTCLAHSRDDRFINLQGLMSACSRTVLTLTGTKVRSMRFLRKPMPALATKLQTPLPIAPERPVSEVPHSKSRFPTPLPSDEMDEKSQVVGADGRLKDISQRIMRKHRERRGSPEDDASPVDTTTALIRREAAAAVSATGAGPAAPADPADAAAPRDPTTAPKSSVSESSRRKRAIGSQGTLESGKPTLIPPPASRKGELIFYRIAILLLILGLVIVAALMNHAVPPPPVQ